MKDIKPLLVIMLAAGLIGTWVYHLYDKTMYTQRRIENFAKDSTLVANTVRDSLSKTYNATLQDMDIRLNSSANKADSIQQTLEAKVSEINRLKTEIGSILSKTDLSQKEMQTAKTMVTDLQQKVDELKLQNVSMEEEKKYLGVKLQELTHSSDSLQRNINRLNEENSKLNEKLNLATVFMATSVRLSAVDIQSARETETLQARKAEKLVIAFTVQNNVSDFNNSEIFIIITQPNNQVLQQQDWDSGTFDARNEGRKNFTRAVRFDYEKGEHKAMIFSLSPEKIEKGKYGLQLWHRGSLIGQASMELR